MDGSSQQHRHGTINDVRSMTDSYKAQVRAFSEDIEKVDIIHPAGKCPFGVLGYDQEQLLVGCERQLPHSGVHFRNEPGPNDAH